MSRSYKKNVILKDGAKSIRQMHRRRERSRNKQRVNQGLEPLNTRTIVNDYDIVDYSWRIEKEDEENYKRFKRK